MFSDISVAPSSSILKSKYINFNVSLLGSVERNLITIIKATILGSEKGNIMGDKTN